MKGLTEIPNNDIPEGCDYRLVTTIEQLEELCQEMLLAEKLAVDTETEGLKFEDVIVGVCISTAPMSGRYIPIRHELIDGHRFDNQLDPQVVFEKIGPILELKPCVGHNVKFDMKAFWKDGVDVNFVQDTLIDANLVGTYQQGKKSLEDLVLQHFQYQMLKLKDLFPKPKGRRKVEIAPAKLAPNDIERYGCEDGDYSLRLADYLEDVINRSGVAPNIRELEMRLLRVVAEMEMHGVPASMEFLKSRSEEIGFLIERLEQEIVHEIRDQVGDPEMEINLNSPKQLGEIIYGHLGIPCTNYTPSGAPSTAGAVMEDLAKKYPLMERILTYRAMIKLKSFILDKMQLRIESDGRIRGGFNQVGTQSGRFSSSDPNLQQIPKDQIFFLWPADNPDEIRAQFSDKIQDCEAGVEGFDDDAGVWKSSIYFGAANDGHHYGVHHNKIYQAWKCVTRNFIEADEDHYLIEADYSQVELRILAGESQEQTFLNAFRDGDDVHKRTAAAIYSIPFEQVVKAQRSVGKTINFGLLYGMGPQKLGASLLISMQEAKDIMNKYFENLPAIKSWINNTKSQAHQDMYSRTRFGRIRRFPDIRSRDQGTKAREEREAVNHCIQGAAADVMKLALCRLNRDMRTHFGDKVRLVLTVHDSVMLECTNDCPPEDVAAVLIKAMQFRPIPTWPMLEIDIGLGQSWGTCKDFTPEEGHPLPDAVDVSSLPKLRVRQVGREREGDFKVDNLFTAVTAPEPVKQEVETVEEIVELTKSSIESPVDTGYTWILEVRDWPTKPRLEKLMSFLQTKSSDEGKHTLKLCFTDSDGYNEEVQLSGRLTLTLEDEMSFRIMLGSCTLRQDIEEFDPSEIVKRLNIGAHSESNAG